MVTDALTQILYLNKSAKLLFGVDTLRSIRNKPLNTIMSTPLPELKHLLLQQMTYGAMEVEYQSQGAAKKAKLLVSKTDVGTYVMSFIL